jgi:hypothetical protein
MISPSVISKSEKDSSVKLRKVWNIDLKADRGDNQNGDWIKDRGGNQNCLMSITISDRV